MVRFATATGGDGGVEVEWGERIAVGSIGIGVAVLILKGAAWWITGSAAPFSDAFEPPEKAKQYGVPVV